MTPSRAVTVLTATVFLVAMSSCTTSNDSGVPMKNTITQQQANERVEQYVRDAVAAISPTASLEVLGGSRDFPCDDPTDNGPKGRVTASRDYWLQDLPADKHHDYIDALIAWWKEHDFALLRDDRPKDTYVTAENRQDGFRMGIKGTVTGPPRLSISASSPCVWPNGTPEPKPPR